MNVVVLLSVNNGQLTQHLLCSGNLLGLCTEAAVGYGLADVLEVGDVPHDVVDVQVEAGQPGPLGCLLVVDVT